MAQKFSLKELQKLYGARSKIEKDERKRSGLEGETNGNSEVESLTEELIEGKTILERLHKLSYIKGLRELNSQQNVVPEKQEGSIAVCLVIVDELRHEEIWRDWVEQGQSESCSYKAELYIHAKYPERIHSDWVKSRTLSHSFRPEWNSPEVVRAMLAVLEKALTNPLNERFIFGTESCIPICNLQEVGDELFQSNVSWADAYHVPKDSYEQQYCFHSVNPSIIPPKYIWKALPGWIMITRRHAEEIVKLPSLVDPERKDLVPAWNTVHAPEEVYFPTMLSLLGFLRDDPNTIHTTQRNSDQNPFIKHTTDEVWRRRVCYAEWRRKTDANPVGFTSLTVELCNHFRRNGSIFARKFGVNTVTLRQWRSVLSEATPLSRIKSDWLNQNSNLQHRITHQPNNQQQQQQPQQQQEREEVKQNDTAEVMEVKEESKNEVVKEIKTSDGGSEGCCSQELGPLESFESPDSPNDHPPVKKMKADRDNPAVVPESGR